MTLSKVHSNNRRVRPLVFASASVEHHLRHRDVSLDHLHRAHHQHATYLRLTPIVARRADEYVIASDEIELALYNEPLVTGVHRSAQPAHHTTLGSIAVEPQLAS